MTDLLLLAVGHALVWAAGICLASLPRWWRERRAGGPIAARADGEFAWTLGAGWLVGAFVLTLVMRGASLAGIPLGRLADRLAAAAGRRRRRRPRPVVGPAGGARTLAVGDPRCDSHGHRQRTSPAAARALAGTPRLARVPLRAASGRGDDPSAVSVGRLDAMGDQGPRLVRAQGHRPVRAVRRLAAAPTAPSTSTPRRTIRRPCRCGRCGRRC